MKKIEIKLNLLKIAGLIGVFFVPIMFKQLYIMIYMAIMVLLLLLNKDKINFLYIILSLSLIPNIKEIHNFNSKKIYEIMNNSYENKNDFTTLVEKYKYDNFNLNLICPLFSDGCISFNAYKKKLSQNFINENKVKANDNLLNAYVINLEILEDQKGNLTYDELDLIKDNLKINEGFKNETNFNKLQKELLIKENNNIKNIHKRNVYLDNKVWSNISIKNKTIYIPLNKEEIIIYNYGFLKEYALKGLNSNPNKCMYLMMGTQNRWNNYKLELVKELEIENNYQCSLNILKLITLVMNEELMSLDLSLKTENEKNINIEELKKYKYSLLKTLKTGNYQ